MKRVYFENAVHCGQCNGNGCKHCNGTGVQTITEYLLNRPSEDQIALAVKFRKALKEFFSNILA